MAKQNILLYLHSIEPPIGSWVIFDENAAILQTTLRTDLSQLAPTAEQEVKVILPFPDILLAQADLPKLSSHRLQQALPYAMEEQLIDDITELHFSVGTYLPNNHWPVAIIAQAKITQWLEILQHFNIIPTAMIPAPLALPWREGHWTLYSIDDLCFVRTHLFSGFTCEVENLTTYLEAKLSEEPQQPIQIDLYSEKSISPSLKAPISMIPHPLSEKQFMESLVQNVKTHPFINLLHGAYRTKHKMLGPKRLWAYAGYVTLAWAAIGLASNLFSLIVLHHHASTMQSSIEKIYKHNFPDAKSMIAPQQRMEEKLKKLSLQASSESFLVLLGHFSKAFSQSNGVRIQNLDYREKQLTLELSATTFDSLDNLTQLLKQEGLIAKQQSAEIVAARVKATLQITAGGA